MRKLLMTMTLVALVASPAAIAQTGNRDSTSSSSQKQTPWPAPVGHRQPRIDEVPPEKNLINPNDLLAKENAILDRKMKSICRGC